MNKMIMVIMLSAPCIAFGKADSCDSLWQAIRATDIAGVQRAERMGCDFAQPNRNGDLPVEVALKKLVIDKKKMDEHAKKTFRGSLAGGSLVMALGAGSDAKNGPIEVLAGAIVGAAGGLIFYGADSVLGGDEYVQSKKVATHLLENGGLNWEVRNRVGSGLGDFVERMSNSSDQDEKDAIEEFMPVLMASKKQFDAAALERTLKEQREASIHIDPTVEKEDVVEIPRASEYRGMSDEDFMEMIFMCLP